MLSNGAVIADRYRLQRLIATGGMGQVWEATDKRLDRRVAVKVLKTEFSTDPTFRERFRAEARTTAQLNHSGIAGIYDYGETRDAQGSETAYVVMELVRGVPLNDVLGRMGRLSLPHALDMLEQTGRALAVAHAAGVVHRDVKPGNILITPTGQVKITDFGIAKAVDSSPVTKTGMVMGTAQYIAPEQALGQDATAASDVYSLGVVGYEALSGQRPFVGDGPLTVAMKHVREAPAPMPTDLPPNVRELIDITLTKDPTTRYSDGGEFADAVAMVRAGHRPPRPGGAASRVLPPPVGSTQVLTSTQQMYAAEPTGYGEPPPGDDRGGMTRAQKALAWAAGGLLLAAALVALWLVLDNTDGGGGTTPTTVTRTVPAEPTTTVPPTTTRAPERTTTVPRPTTTTTQPLPPPPPPTTAPPTTTQAPTTTAPLLPDITLPELPLPGAMGDDEEDATTTTTPPAGNP
ncbi:MAG: serine/threonine protein kinase [Aldersonia sp.]|nr:serine/threonine protein kinase [Aldersonia sp.]